MGTTGSRLAAPKDLGFASAYVFGAVCPLEGKAAALIMPICNTVAMNHHLLEIGSQVAANAHAVVILDGAGWHRSQALVVPSNITLLALPPYSPELNPTTAWSARSARSPGLRLRPLYSWCLLSSRGLQLKHTHIRKFPEIRFQAIPQASMMSARLANTELASQ